MGEYIVRKYESNNEIQQAIKELTIDVMVRENRVWRIQRLLYK